MVKNVIVYVLFIIALWGGTSYGEETTVSDYVYCNGQTPTLEQAISQVNPNGTVYITNPININSPIYIDKSVKIQSLNKEEYKVSILGTGAFTLSDNISSFTLENIHIKSFQFYKFAIEGKAKEINIINSVLEKASVNIIGGSGYRIAIKDSNIFDSKLEMKANPGKNILILYNNEFSVDSRQYESIIFENTNLEISQNIFSDYTFKIDEGEEIEGNIYNNTFCGVRNITINIQGENLKFYNNKILKESNYGINYSGDYFIDFRNNWWGFKDGPQNIYLGNENIDYSNWALFEDFSRFQGDDYTLEDLKEACNKLGQAIEENWLYNLKEDTVIDKLDLIGITRRVRASYE